MQKCVQKLLQKFVFASIVIGILKLISCNQMAISTLPSIQAETMRETVENQTLDVIIADEMRTMHKVDAPKVVG